MAFDSSAFARAGHANSDIPTLWMYKTADTQATINTAGYFNDKAGDLTVGDLIYAFTDTGGTPAGFLFAVNANDGSTVDVTDGLAIGTTDTD